MEIKISRSAVKAVDVKAPMFKVFAYIMSPLSWPKWNASRLKTIEPTSDGWYRLVTAHGSGALKFNADRESGTFDHIWRDGQGTLRVAARVLPNGSGSTITMTLIKPPALADEEFDAQMKGLDADLGVLRDLLEKAA